MSTILITGGTGMIGTALSQMLVEKGYDVILLTRTAGGREVGNGKIVRMQWDPEKGTIDSEAIQRADHIVHLAGAGVADKRWSAKRKREIVESRTHSSALIVKALGEIPNKVKTVVSASGIGWYGPDPSIPNPRPFVETDPVDDDFLGETCRLWEESISGVAGPAGRMDIGRGDGSGRTDVARADASGKKDGGALDKRLVIFRIGLVLSNAGGALAEFRKPVKMGVAAILGSGKQVMSWIHVEDLCRLFVAAIENNNWAGVYNAVAPQPVDNKTLTLELAKRLKGRYYVPVYVPTFILKIVVGEMSIEVLKSTTVSVQKLREAGFQFLHPSMQNALDDLLKS